MHLKPRGNRLPVGPGSRGGHWHDPEYRRSYWRMWRRAHPDYREREVRRLRERKRRARLERDRREVEELVAWLDQNKPLVE